VVTLAKGAIARRLVDADRGEGGSSPLEDQP
jgi:hypothetical protein